jgi:Na+/H+-dicarboxylate symporter
VVAGGLTGYFLGDKAAILKPFGDVLLNLMFTIVVPLVFFSVSSAIANLKKSSQFTQIILGMVGAFLFTSIIAAIYMLIVVKIFPIGTDIAFDQLKPVTAVSSNIGNQLVEIFTVPDFGKLFSRDHMLALIVFSLLVGVATSSLGEKSKAFTNFLNAGNDVFIKMISFVMCYAPIGFFAYFAVLVAEYGPKLFGAYFHTFIIYYPAAIIYFVVIMSGFAYLAYQHKGVTLFWQNIFGPTLMALATCSSAASIPVNLSAAKKMGVHPEIYDLVIPLGTIVHKDGSVLGGILKIAFLFSIFHLPFTGPFVLVTALAIGILVGTVMGAIPSGGLIGKCSSFPYTGSPRKP